MTTHIRKLSRKREKEMRDYSKVRVQYLTEHPVCEVRGEGCNYYAFHIHHKKGKIGLLLTDTRYFLAVCPACHDKIERNPLWAKELGYSLSRLAKLKGE